jgi:hypothetical protein
MAGPVIDPGTDGGTSSPPVPDSMAYALPLDGGSGKLLDHAQLVRSDGVVVSRQRVVTGDPVDHDAQQQVMARDPYPTDYGAVVRPVPGGADAQNLSAWMYMIWQELRELNEYLRTRG